MLVQGSRQRDSKDYFRYRGRFARFPSSCQIDNRLSIGVYFVPNESLVSNLFRLEISFSRLNIFSINLCIVQTTNRLETFWWHWSILLSIHATHQFVLGLVFDLVRKELFQYFLEYDLQWRDTNFLSSMLQHYDYLVSSWTPVIAKLFDDDLSICHEKLSMLMKPVKKWNTCFKLKLSMNTPRMTVTFVLWLKPIVSSGPGKKHFEIICEIHFDSSKVIQQLSSSRQCSFWFKSCKILIKKCM